MYYYGFIADSDFDASKINTSSLPLCQTSTPTPQPVLVPIETQL